MQKSIKKQDLNKQNKHAAQETRVLLLHYLVDNFYRVTAH